MKFLQVTLGLLCSSASVFAAVTENTLLYGTAGSGGVQSVLWKISDWETVSPNDYVEDVQEIGAINVGGTAVSVDALTYDYTTGVMLAFTDRNSALPYSLLAINVDTAEATLVANFSAESPALGSLAVDTAGQVYGYDEVNTDLFKLIIDPVTKVGTTLKIGSASLAGVDVGLAFERGDDTKIHLVTGNGNYFTVDTSTGTATQRGFVTDPNAFDGSHGDLNPDLDTYLQFWQPEDDPEQSNTRIQVIKLDDSTIDSARGIIRTRIDGLHTLAFLTDFVSAQPSAQPSPAPTPAGNPCDIPCTTAINLSGRNIKGDIFGLCFDLCLSNLSAIIVQIIAGWECGEC